MTKKSLPPRLVNKLLSLPGVPRFLYRTRQTMFMVNRPINIGVRALVTDEDANVLLVRHSYMGGWHMPGGGVNRWEPLAHACLRELWEETGIRAETVAGLLGIYTHLRRHNTNHVAVFTVTDWVRESLPESWEILEHGFFPMGDLPANTSRGTRDRLAEHAGDKAIDFIW